MTICIAPDDALIVVDIQNDFIPGGSLPVSGAGDIISNVNDTMKVFLRAGARIVLTQDWHPEDHLSFASQHNGKNPFDPIEGIDGIGPVLWPDHCVQRTAGAEFHPDLDVDAAHLILRKGIHRQIDSYSAFTENDNKTDTGLAGYLENSGLKRIFICGLALDYCVFWSAMDGRRKELETSVITDLCRGIEEDTTKSAKSQMISAGVRLTEMKEF